MGTFVTIHRAPGLSAEEITANAPAVIENKYASFRQMYANLIAGFIVSIYEADDRAAVEREFERIGFPFTEMHEVQFAGDAEQLAAMVTSGSAS